MLEGGPLWGLYIKLCQVEKTIINFKRRNMAGKDSTGFNLSEEVRQQVIEQFKSGKPLSGCIIRTIPSQ